jgi:hypothetical protein
VISVLRPILGQELDVGAEEPERAPPSPGDPGTGERASSRCSGRRR